jgi:hypothetical protein
MRLELSGAGALGQQTGGLTVQGCGWGQHFCAELRLIREPVCRTHADMAPSTLHVGLVSVFSLALGACLAPPPEGAAAPSQESTSTESSSTSAPAAPAAAGEAKAGIVWNGDDVNPSAKGWNSCDTQPCKALVEPAPKVGKDKTIGLAFQAEGSGYLGFGWNWTSWYAAGASNVTGLKNLRFWLQIVPESKELAPDPKGIRVGLRCAADKDCGKEIGSLDDYVKNSTDGQWHEVVIPLGDMKLSDGSKWDDKSVWEIGLHNWAPTPRKFVAHIDNIGFD